MPDSISFNWTAWRSFRALINQTQALCEAGGEEHKEHFHELTQLLDALEVEFDAPEIARAPQ